MDKKEVTVSIRGLNFNTPDSLVMAYLKKHGDVVSDKVIYDVAKEGPFKGLKNGDRKYLVDFSKGRNLGSYHIIDGSRIEIRYQGQRRTCGRCQRTALECPGNAVARVCQEKNGPKITLRNHMIDYCKLIGFEHPEFKLPEDINDERNDMNIKESATFTPPYKSRKPSSGTAESFTALLVKNLPSAIPDKDIIEEFSKESLSDNVHINITRDGGDKATAELSNLDPDEAESLITNFRGKMYFGNKLFCKKMKSIFSPKKSADGAATEESDCENEDDVSPIKPDIPGLSIPKELSKSKKKKLKRKEQAQKRDAKLLTAKHFLKVNNLSKSVDDDEFEFEELDCSKIKPAKTNNVNGKENEKVSGKKRGLSSPDDQPRRIRSKSVGQREH